MAEEEKRKVEYFDRRGYRWKVEGKVATMQAMLLGAEKTCKAHYEAETDEQRIERVNKAKAFGIEIVEFWVAKDGLDIVKKTWEKLGKKHGFTFEVVREEERTVFCRLYL